MAKKIRFNKKKLNALFDFNSFSPNQNLEKIAKESLERNGATSEPLEMDTLENLSAAGNSSKMDIPTTL